MSIDPVSGVAGCLSVAIQVVSVAMALKQQKDEEKAALTLLRDRLSRWVPVFALVDAATYDFEAFEKDRRRRSKFATDIVDQFNTNAPTEGNENVPQLWSEAMKAAGSNWKTAIAKEAHPLSKVGNRHVHANMEAIKPFLDMLKPMSLKLQDILDDIRRKVERAGRKKKSFGPKLQLRAQRMDSLVEDINKLIQLAATFADAGAAATFYAFAAPVIQEANWRFEASCRRIKGVSIPLRAVDIQKWMHPARPDAKVAPTKQPAIDGAWTALTEAPQNFAALWKVLQNTYLGPMELQHENYDFGFVKIARFALSNIIFQRCEDPFLFAIIQDTAVGLKSDYSILWFKLNNDGLVQVGELLYFVTQTAAKKNWERLMRMMGHTIELEK